MKGINGGKTSNKKAGDVTTQLQDLQKKKEGQSKVNDKPKVEDFLPLIQKMKVKLVPIKNDYTAIKNKKGKVLTYVRDTSYGFNFENRSDKGIWLVEKITKKSQLEEKVDVIKQRLRG